MFILVEMSDKVSKKQTGRGFAAAIVAVVQMFLASGQHLKFSRGGALLDQCVGRGRMASKTIQNNTMSPQKHPGLHLMDLHHIFQRYHWKTGGKHTHTHTQKERGDERE